MTSSGIIDECILLPGFGMLLSALWSLQILIDKAVLRHRMTIIMVDLDDCSLLLRHSWRVVPTELSHDHNPLLAEHARHPRQSHLQLSNLD